MDNIALSAVFQSTLPVWGATDLPDSMPWSSGISIHAPRVGSDYKIGDFCVDSGISIHAPRVGSDNLVLTVVIVFIISIHAPRVGSDRYLILLILGMMLFQSTLPVWGATICG